MKFIIYNINNNRYMTMAYITVFKFTLTHAYRLREANHYSQCIRYRTCFYYTQSVHIYIYMVNGVYKMVCLVNNTVNLGTFVLMHRGMVNL